MSQLESDAPPDGIAIIGLAGRFPGARNTSQYWKNIAAGVESIRFFSEEELAGAGVPSDDFNNPAYVPAKGIVDDIELFDASFFKYSPREAEILDPQHRFFLECAWEALESAGYDPEQYEGSIGVFAGATWSSYLLHNLITNPKVLGSAGSYQLMLGNDKDYLATRVSYKLNLKGPAMTVQSGCSTSLVAAHQACLALLNYQCDMALAGGVSIVVPQKEGYLYQEGMIASRDGHCRPFDAKANGTVGGEGVGIVVLKRLEEALQDGDNIYAVIRGSAINNDGSIKVGFTAPSVEGQAEVIQMAQAIASVHPESIAYIEAHGTATEMGDPIEVAALTQAFRSKTSKTGFCAIGSVKGNIGHLDAAAGVAALIKTALALKYEQMPPSVNYTEANPAIDFQSSPFYVNTKLSNWDKGLDPRRAGVSSFGIGGTNAHMILEEAPPLELPMQEKSLQLLPISARSGKALDVAAKNLAEFMKENPALNLADVAYTLQLGRRAFEQRRFAICDSQEEVIQKLSSQNFRNLPGGGASKMERPVVFMFTGQGVKILNAGRGLYNDRFPFRRHFNLVAELLQTKLGFDLRKVIYPEDNQPSSEIDLQQTQFLQPAIFAVEYALAQQWIEWGIRPQAMIGHSIGEYVAACLAGVFSLEDALSLVVARGKVMQAMPAGGMLAVPLPEDKVVPLLAREISIAAVNAPGQCVVSGPKEALEKLNAGLEKEDLGGRWLNTSHAFHSSMMDGALEPFRESFRKIKFHSPQIPYISNLTGAWIKEEEACSPEYWIKHLRQTVRFSAGIVELLKTPGRVLLETGPGQTLTSLARQHLTLQDVTTPQNAAVVVSSLHHTADNSSDSRAILNSLGALWASGCKVDWIKLHAGKKRLRVPLPAYPFERERYWLEPPSKHVNVRSDLPVKRELEQEPNSEVAAENNQEPSHARPILANSFVAPENDLQKTIAAIWENMLGIAPVGLFDSFYDLGGHSLLATQVISRVKDQLHLNFSLRSLFEKNTVAEWVEHIETMRWVAVGQSSAKSAEAREEIEL